MTTRHWSQVLGVDRDARSEEIETVYVERKVALEDAFEARDDALDQAIEAMRRERTEPRTGRVEP